MHHPFAQFMGLVVEEQGAGFSRCSLRIVPEQHHNPNRVTHGAVLYALADTGMGAALQADLAAGEMCATIEIKINYFRAIREGRVECRTEVLNRGRTIANLESRLHLDGRLVAQANGNFAIFAARAPG